MPKKLPKVVVLTVNSGLMSDPVEGFIESVRRQLLIGIEGHDAPITKAIAKFAESARLIDLEAMERSGADDSHLDKLPEDAVHFSSVEFDMGFNCALGKIAESK